MGVCSDSNQTAQPHQIPMLKNLEMISGINYNKLQTKFAAKFAWKKGLQMKSNVWKPCRLTVQTCIGWASLEYLLKRIWKNLPLKIIIYCGTDQPLLVTAWFQRSVLNFKLSVLTFLRLMFDEHWAKNLWREIFQIHSMSNQLQCDSMCWSKYFSPEFQFAIFDHTYTIYFDISIRACGLVL